MEACVITQVTHKSPPVRRTSLDKTLEFQAIVWLSTIILHPIPRGVRRPGMKNEDSWVWLVVGALGAILLGAALGSPRQWAKFKVF